MIKNGPALATAAAIGLAAAAATDAALAVGGAARFGGPPLGLLAIALLMLLGSGTVRRNLTSDAERTLLVIGAAWTVAPFLDQHLTGAVVITGAAADVAHHTAGWAALAAATVIRWGDHSAISVPRSRR